MPKSKALEWVAYAESDFGVASHLNEIYRPLPTNTICWLCQQSVEKAYKAILAYHDVKIPKTHNIWRIQQTTVGYESGVNIDVKIADKITEFATESRYPDNVFDFTMEDAKLGLKYSKQVLKQVRETLKLPQKPSSEETNEVVVEDEEE